MLVTRDSPQIRAENGDLEVGKMLFQRHTQQQQKRDKNNISRQQHIPLNRNRAVSM